MSRPIEEKEAIRIDRYEPFRTFLKQGELSLATSPERWWFSSALLISRSLKQVRQFPDQYPPQIPEFIESYAPKLLAVLRIESRLKGDELTQTHPARAVMVMHEMSDTLMADEEIEHQEREIHHLSHIEICAQTERIKNIETGGRQYLSIWSDNHSEWYNYPLPKTDKVLHKGGVGRTILKILAGAKQETIEASLPPNDFDYLVVKDKEGLRDARELGADPDGVESVDQFNLQELMNNRDLDINNAFVGRDGIFFSNDAFEAARTGKISVVSTKRGIYGSEVFYYDGVRILKNRGIMRLLKTVAEGKALSFDFLPINRQVNLGIYWLVLAKRFERKDQFPVIMDRLFRLAGQMGQVPEDTGSVIDLLDAMHTKYPFFDFESVPLDEVGVARWLGKKFIRQIDKKYRDQAEIPSMQPLVREPGDSIPYEVNLNGYVADPVIISQIRDSWNEFRERSRRRIASHNIGAFSVPVDTFTDEGLEDRDPVDSDID